MAERKILKSTSIYDGISDGPVSGGLVIDGNRITGVFPEDELNDYITPDTEVTDYGDKLIMPGFIDSHLHMGQAMDFLDPTYCIDLDPARNFDDVVALLRKFGEENPDAKVLFGINYNYFNLTPPVIPDVHLLDKYFPDKPVLILTWEIHTYYANTKAIELTGLTKDTPDPNNGIIKDENGELTGAFNDTVAFAVTRIVQRPLFERGGALINFMKELNSYGITAVGDMFPCGADKPYPLYKKYEDQLTVRVSFYPELMSFTPELANEYKREYNGPMLQFAGLKNLIDGVISVHTAWMSEPYYDDPTTSGYPAIPAEQVKAKILEALSLGINVRIHTIGDEAIHYVLDVFEEAKNKYGLLPRRNVMEHLEYVNDEDLHRFKDLNVVCDMQGRHITFYVDDGEKIMGPERSRRAFRWRDVLDAGAIIGTGSDYPVVHFDPARCIYAAVTRQLEDGHPKDGWIPEQRVSLAEALRAYNYGSACALNREDEIGLLKNGYYADVVVLDKNLFAVPEDEILGTKPILTMVDGKTVYES